MLTAHAPLHAPHVTTNLKQSGALTSMSTAAAAPPPRLTNFIYRIPTELIGTWQTLTCMKPESLLRSNLKRSKLTLTTQDYAYFTYKLLDAVLKQVERSAAQHSTA